MTTQGSESPTLNWELKLPSQFPASACLSPRYFGPLVSKLAARSLALFLLLLPPTPLSAFQINKNKCLNIFKMGVECLSVSWGWHCGTVGKALLAMSAS